MLALKTTAKRGDVDYETVVYVTDENIIRIYQYQFDGPIVLSTNCIEVTIDQLASVATSTSEIYLQRFFKEYKAE